MNDTRFNFDIAWTMMSVLGGLLVVVFLMTASVLILSDPPEYFIAVILFLGALEILALIMGRDEDTVRKKRDEELGISVITKSLDSRSKFTEEEIDFLQRNRNMFYYTIYQRAQKEASHDA